ncbi:transcriptional regulator [Sphingomonas sp. RT2P30]|uniref:transcriptional regulator n=1 Tax=Parasphingomonas halimpatiens TaxID=3096162 RepID=UPI002FC6CD47
MTARLTFDPVIHAPARLQIMAVLAGVQDAEFAMLRTTADVSDSVLSKHLAALNEAGYVRLRKAALDGRQRTWVSLTRAGRTAFRDHVAALTALARVVDTVDDAAVSGDLAVGSA